MISNICSASLLLAFLLIWKWDQKKTKSEMVKLSAAGEFKTMTINDRDCTIHYYFKSPHNCSSQDNQKLFVFVHGLGGQLHQFLNLISSLESKHGCLAFDLPGHGFSQVSLDPNSYRLDTFVKILHEMVDFARARSKAQKIILVGHSYGCQIIAVAAYEKRIHDLYHLVMIAPKAFISNMELSKLKYLPFAPILVLEFLRWLDKVGGISSVSVSRMVSKNASKSIRQMQLSYNCHTPSIAIKYTLLGMRQITSPPSNLYEYLANTPTFLVSPLDDQTCPHSRNGQQIINWMHLNESSYLTLKKTGHSVMLERPNEVATVFKSLFS